MIAEPGRACPLHYRYQPTDIARIDSQHVETLYVVGGLYGNPLALRTLIDLTNTEPGSPVICFNGDFNWFNISDAAYRSINETVLRHTVVRGNVETELATGTDGAGCGCGYPEWVNDDTVKRSNAIMIRLQEVAARHKSLTARLSGLPMFARFEVGGRRVAVVHGDAESLAGWGFALETMDRPEQQACIQKWFDAAEADIFASTHTCLPVLRRFDKDQVVINNGAAGMPNIAGTRYGIVTRIATTPAPFETLYGCESGDVHVDALPLHYPQDEWLEEFLSQWPPGSPAHLSYFDRLKNGPDVRLNQCRPTRV